MKNNEIASASIDTPASTDLVPRRFMFTLPIYGLLGMALLYTLYFAKTLLMPIVVALLFSLLLSPLVTLFKRFHVPRALSAILLLTMIGGPVTLLVIELATPAQTWLAQVPKLTAQVHSELDNLSSTISPETVPEEKGFSFFGWFSSDDEPKITKAKPNSALSARVTEGGIETVISILGATPLVIAQFLTTIILVLVLLIFGPRLYENYLTIFPSKQGELHHVALIDTLQKELSRYILTVTAINSLLGVVTASIFWMMGVNDALLWGALITLLNFAPYVGPILVLAVLSLAGIAQYGLELAAGLPVAIYFCINLIESQFVTPTVMGRHMQLNPLVLILWLLAWGWLWGPVGVLLAVPLLVCIKLAAAQLNILTKWIKLIETST